MWLPALVGLVTALVTVLIWRALINQEETAISRTVQQAADEVRNLIVSHLESRNLALKRVAQRWETDRGTPRKRWEADVLQYVTDYPDYQAIEWVDPQYHVRWIVPLAGNEAARDLNLAFEPRRRQALEAARAKRAVTVTHAIDLVQGGKGFLVYVPIFIDDGFGGFILGVYRIKPLLDVVLPKTEVAMGYEIEITDRGQTIYQRGQPRDPQNTRWAESSVAPLQGPQWEIHVWPQRETLAAMRSPMLTVFLAVGLVGSALLAVTTHLAQTSLKQASDLRFVNAQLKDEVRERAETQKTLDQRNMHLHLLQVISEAANEAQDVEEAMQTAVDEVCAHTGWPIGHVYLRGEDGSGDLISTTIWHLDDADRFEALRRVTEATPFDSGIGLPGRVLATGRPAWIMDVNRDPNFPRAKLADDLGVKAGFAFPILIGREVTAVLEFFAQDTVEPNTSLLETVVHLGMTLGRVVERKRAEAAVRESEQRFELVVQGSHDGFWDWHDVEGDEEWWSPRFYELLGYQEGEIPPLLSTFRDLVHRDDVERTFEAVRAHFEDYTPFDTEYRLRTKSGSYRWFRVRGVAVRDETGKPIRMAGSIQDIHDRRMTEEALQASEERFELAVQGTSEGLWDWDVVTNTVWYAPRFKELLGYDGDEFPHVFESFEAALHPKDKKPTLEAVRRHLEDNEPFDVQYRLRTKGGEYRWFRARGVAIRDESGKPIRMAGSIQDITDDRKYQQLINQQATAISSTMEGIALLDSEGRYTFMNKAHAEMYGFDDPEELLCRSWQTLYEPEEAAKLEQEAFPALARDGRWHGEVTGKKKDGTLFEAEVSLTALDCGGLVCVCRDITKRKHAEDAIRAKNRDLETLLYVTSHDLREPLRAIQNFSRMVNEKYAEVLDDKGRDFLRRVVRGADRMDQLFEDILTLSRAQRSDVTRERIDTDGLVRDVLDRLSNRINESLARVSVAPNLPALHGDRRWIVQAVYNLVANALKFTVDDQPPEIEIAGYRGNGEDENRREVGLCVRDRGPGVEEGQRERIFKLFQRAVGRQIEGTGAGLAIVQQIAVRHGGRVWVEAREGGGSEFIVTFGLGDSSLSQLREAI